MSDSYGSLHRARYRRIAGIYGHDIASLHYDVFDTGSSFGPMVIPKIHGRARRPIPSTLRRLIEPRGSVSLPLGPQKRSSERMSSEKMAYLEEKRAYQLEKARYRAAKRRR